MRLVVVHNYYQQRGGEERVFEDELRMLAFYGHHVVPFTVSNDGIDGMEPLELACATMWNTDTYRKLSAVLAEHRPHVVHFHNTLPLVSPAAYYAARRCGAAVVQTLHNYRLLCPGALLLREARICEDCLGRRIPLPGVMHGCYRGSRTASAAVTAMVSVHRMLGTWKRRVNLYVVTTRFVQRKFIEGGVPSSKLVVKPHFVFPDPGPVWNNGGYALFVGRLSREKGVSTLLSAWRRLGSHIPLKIVGDGPLSNLVCEAAAGVPGVEWLGWRTPEEVLNLMGTASVVVVPSECYETFGRVVIEAYAVGTPVIVANIGALAELVDHGRTGRLFRTGDPDSLVAEVDWMLAHDSARQRMAELARAEYEEKYTAARNHDELLGIYGKAQRGLRRSAKVGLQAASDSS